ncbi:heavy metal sensor histidine kinase [Pseudomonas sp.]|uniref:heavy metal sensor histidine kinase n=1 Tax=Pseudomonas sp. TaxID=306 RepID=UPI003BB7A879
MMRISLTARLSLLFMLAVTAVLVLAGLSFNHLSQHHFLQLDRQTLAEKLSATRNILGQLDDLQQFDRLRPQLRTLLGAHRDITALILDAAGQPLFAEPGPLPVPAALANSTSTEVWQWQHHDHYFRGLSAAVTVPADNAPLRVILLLDSTPHMHFFSAVQRWFWMALVLSALFSAGLGWLVARRGLQPLRRVTAVAASISAASLQERIPLAAVPLELQQLAASFNAMLARLDDAFMRLSNFSADIAHELRTPLSNLMTQTEVVLAQPRDSEAYQETLYANLDDCKRMARMIDDMLFLAKADNGLIVPEQQPVALDIEVEKLFEYYRLLADERGISLQLHGHAVVRGDVLMLHRALSNLLSNALRYTPAGASIQVELEQNANGSELRLSNPGPTIADEHLERLFDRFYRADPARREGSPHNAGLGLAITRSIIHAHQGQIHCTSVAGKTTFCVQFPAVAQ